MWFRRHHTLLFAATWINSMLHSLNQAQPLVQVQQTFADTLTAELYRITKNDNECTSALGISMAFDLINPSAQGESRTELQQVFGFTDTSLAWAGIATALQSTFQGKCLGGNNGGCDTYEPMVRIANRIYVRNDVTLDARYAAIVEDMVQLLDFSAETVGSTINAWVESQTKGLIPSIVGDGPLGETLVLLAVNALYFKATWYNIFSKALNNEDTFYTSATRKTAVASKAHFMHKIEYFMYSQEAVPNNQILQLPIRDAQGISSLSMIFVLPMDDRFAPVASVDVVAALTELNSTRVALALPKFRYESTYDDELVAALQAMGLVAPFQGGLCVQEVSSCDNKVDFVIQKTVIDVNEKSVEAVAVTAIGVGMAAAPPRDAAMVMMCDHPFQFFIYEATHNVVLFEGRVGNPGIPKGSTTPELQAWHSDPDFWSTYFFGVETVIVEPQQDIEPPVLNNKRGTKNTDNGTKDASSTAFRPYGGKFVSSLCLVNMLGAWF